MMACDCVSKCSRFNQLPAAARFGTILAPEKDVGAGGGKGATIGAGSLAVEELPDGVGCLIFQNS